jgi:hypothetical protein
MKTRDEGEIRMAGSHAMAIPPIPLLLLFSPLLDRSSYLSARMHLLFAGIITSAERGDKPIIVIR